jgi:hypothetical protein
MRARTAPNRISRHPASRPPRQQNAIEHLLYRRGITTLTPPGPTGWISPRSERPVFPGQDVTTEFPAPTGAPRAARNMRGVSGVNQSGYPSRLPDMRGRIGPGFERSDRRYRPHGLSDFRRDRMPWHGISPDVVTTKLSRWSLTFAQPASGAMSVGNCASKSSSIMVAELISPCRRAELARSAPHAAAASRWFGVP